MVRFCTTDGFQPAVHTACRIVRWVCKVYGLSVNWMNGWMNEWMNRVTCSCARMYILTFGVAHSSRKGQTPRWESDFSAKSSPPGLSVRSMGMRDRDICSLVKSNAVRCFLEGQDLDFPCGRFTKPCKLQPSKGGRWSFIRYRLGKQRLLMQGLSVWDYNTL